MKLELLYTVVLTCLVTIIGRMVWDWLKSGRAHEDKYATKKEIETVVDHCQQFRAACCLPQLKSRISTLEERSVNEKTLMTDIREDFKSMRSELQNQGVHIGQIEANIVTLINRDK